MVTSGQRNIFYHTIAIITVVIWGTTFIGGVYIAEKQKMIKDEE